MAVLQEKDKSLPRVIVSVTKTSDAEKLAEIFKKLNVPIFYRCRGKGTAPSEMLDIFGLGGTSRVVTAALVSKSGAHTALKDMTEQLFYHQKGGGIAFTLPLTGLQGQVLELVNNNTSENVERNESDMQENNKKTELSLIWVSVKNGYSDDVVDAARTAGAQGGTVLKGIRHVSADASSTLGVPENDEQDMVMIVVPKEKKADVMSAVATSCGISTPAHGVVLAMPVEESIGLEL